MHLQASCGNCSLNQREQMTQDVVVMLPVFVEPVVPQWESSLLEPVHPPFSPIPLLQFTIVVDSKWLSCCHHLHDVAWLLQPPQGSTTPRHQASQRSPLTLPPPAHQTICPSPHHEQGTASTDVFVHAKRPAFVNPTSPINTQKPESRITYCPIRKYDASICMSSPAVFPNEL